MKLPTPVPDACKNNESPKQTGSLDAMLGIPGVDKTVMILLLEETVVGVAQASLEVRTTQKLSRFETNEVE